MPELPEVETTVRGLTPVLLDATLALVEPRRGDLRRPFPPELRQRLTGARVTALSRRAKYGLIDTDRGDTLIFHLGMSGRWRVDPVELLAHDHLLIETGAGRLAAIPAQACRLTISPASGLSRVRLGHRAVGGSLRDRGSAASTRDRPERSRHDRARPRNARGGTVYDRRGE